MLCQQSAICFIWVLDRRNMTTHSSIQLHAGFSNVFYFALIAGN
jgi:hypothetical protein